MWQVDLAFSLQPAASKSLSGLKAASTCFTQPVFAQRKIMSKPKTKSVMSLKFLTVAESKQVLGGSPGVIIIN